MLFRSRTYHSVGGSIFEQFLIILRNSCYENNCSDTFEWEWKYIIIECKNDKECGREGGREKEREWKREREREREIEREKETESTRKREADKRYGGMQTDRQTGKLKSNLDRKFKSS